ncbi:MAG: glycoside hydrolase family 57 protein [Patescibacteria group bacterium]
MPQVCLYFQLHQPYRLRDFQVFELGNHSGYFSHKESSSVDNHLAEKQLNEDINCAIFRKVSAKSYLPMLSLLLELVEQQPEFCFAISASGVFLEQAEAYQPEVIELLQKLAESGQVEFLSETYYHSLAFLYSPEEFVAQVDKHSQLIGQLFGQKPKVFRNTELIYSNQIAESVAELGFQGMLTEAVEPYLGKRPKTQVYVSYTPSHLPLLLKHAELSDDIAFRFGDKNWQSHPLSAKKYLHWLESYKSEEIINLFMDFETFGEHQWSDTGIFEFFRHFVYEFLQSKWNRFVTPTQIFSAIEDQHSLPAYDVPRYISWADVDRDLTAWLGNDLQKDSLRALYELENEVLASQDEMIIADWRCLQTSDHFYYMCTKWSADGDIHAYFSPYQDPFEAYRRYSLVLADLRERLL